MHKISDIISIIRGSSIKKDGEIQKEDENKIVGKEVLGEVSVPIKTLYTEYNFSYSDRYKESVWEKVQDVYGKYLADGSMGDISVMRVCMKHIDQYLANFSFQTSCSSVPYFFDYRSSDEKTKRWYLNFADPILFVASRGGLFAQDEIQTLEHPLLCAVKAYLATTDIKGLESYTKVGNIPTPYLFKNVPYLVEIDTQPIVDGKKVSIYGNAFSYYEYNDPEVLKRAIKVRKNCSFSNIIAMAAPSPKYGCYDKDTILEMFASVVSAFEGAKCMSENKAVEIHTGRWGAGAFGGNEELALIVQILGARIAKIDNLVFHAITDKYLVNATIVVNDIAKLYNENKRECVDGIVNYLFDKKYQWGVSDGN